MSGLGMRTAQTSFLAEHSTVQSVNSKSECAVGATQTLIGIGADLKLRSYAAQRAMLQQLLLYPRAARCWTPPHQLTP